MHAWCLTVCTLHIQNINENYCVYRLQVIIMRRPLPWYTMQINVNNKMFSNKALKRRCALRISINDSLTIQVKFVRPYCLLVLMVRSVYLMVGLQLLTQNMNCPYFFHFSCYFRVLSPLSAAIDRFAPNGNGTIFDMVAEKRKWKFTNNNEQWKMFAYTFILSVSVAFRWDHKFDRSYNFSRINCIRHAIDPWKILVKWVD